MQKNWQIMKWMLCQTKLYVLKLLLIVFLGMFISVSGVAMAITSKALIDAALGLGNHMLRTGIILAMIILARMVVQAVLSMYETKVYETIYNQLQSKMFYHLTRVEMVEMNKYHSGDIITRMTSDLEQFVDAMVNVFPGFLSVGAGLITAFVALYSYDTILAILAFTLGPMAMLFCRLFSHRLKAFYQNLQKAESAYQSFLQESIQNMLIIKTFCYENESNKQLKQYQKEQLHWILKRNRLSVLSGSIMSVGYWVGYFLAFSWGAMKLSEGVAAFGTLAALLQLVQQVQTPILELAGSVPQFILMGASAERLIEIEKLSQESYDDVDYTDKKIGITLDKVSYHYEEATPVLSNINMKLDAGEMVGIIGASGEGKTTLIRLLLALIKPKSGNVYYDINHKQRRIAGSNCRSVISYVPQGNTLFSGTISDNLCYGKTNASEEEQIEALKAADAWEFVQRLPNGIDTKLGESGTGISEGQAQRIAIARALLRKSQILILDEATSALDSNTEQKIIDTISNLKPVRTCVIITHRLSMLSVCNRIYKIESGQMKELDQTILNQAI